MAGWPRRHTTSLSEYWEPTARPEALTDGLGTRWAIANGYHKMFACCQYTHSAIEASLQLREKFAGRSAELEQIVVETHPLAMQLTTVEPETTLAAKFSIPHAAAAIAARGSAGQESFAETTLQDAEIAKLRRIVEMRPHPSVGAWPNDRPARVTWRFRNGEQGAAECLSARGGAGSAVCRSHDQGQDCEPDLRRTFRDSRRA